MKQIAVDIVLLPEQKVSNWAIAANHTLVQQGNTEIQLNPQDCLPHVSLAMGTMFPDNIPNLGTRLTSTWQQHQVNVLDSLGIAVTKNSRGGFTSSLAIHRTPALQHLHEQILHISAPHLQYDRIEADMFRGDGSIDDAAIQWVASYPEKSGFDNFQPHITLGFGVLETNQLPKTFSPSALALCHLGNHCTCRKILWLLDITPEDH